MITNGIYDKARLIPSPNKGGRISPTAIIVHDTAGSLQKGSSVRWLTNPKAKASAHFVIERDGTVTQLVSCNLRAWHAGVSQLKGRSNVNNFSIGIEIVNPGLLSPSGAKGARASYGEVFDRGKYRIEEVPKIEGATELGHRITHPKGLWMPYTQAQIDAVTALCIDICNTYPISDLQPHWYISPGRKIDTNPLFPLTWLKHRLAGREDIERLVEVAEGAVLRAWPSFYSSNIFQEKPKFVELVDKDLYELVGDFIPPYMQGRKMEWAKVRFDDKIAFVDPADIAEV